MRISIAAALTAACALMSTTAFADILYCSKGDGQVTIRSNNYPPFTSTPDVKSAILSQLIQQPASVRVDLIYKDESHDSFVMVGETMVQFHGFLREPGDGAGKFCH